MPPSEKDTPGFKDLGSMPIPDRENAEDAKTVKTELKSIRKGQVVKAVRKAAGEEDRKKTEIPASVPKLIFHLGAKFIDCEKFNLDEKEANLIAQQLTILIPIDGKIAPILIIIAIVVEKVVVCFDRIMLKFGKTEGLDKTVKKPDLPEPIK